MQDVLGATPSGIQAIKNTPEKRRTPQQIQQLEAWEAKRTRQAIAYQQAQEHDTMTRAGFHH